MRHTANLAVLNESLYVLNIEVRVIDVLDHVTAGDLPPYQN
jgi:hypothetical protein